LLLAVSLWIATGLNAGEIDDAAQGLLDAGAAGLSMAMVDSTGITWSQSRGFADVEQSKPMSIDTVMNIASISKTFTSASLMLLVAQGRLDLDRDVNDYLPFTLVNPRHPEAVVTTRQLLTHTSAIIDREEIYYSDFSYHPGGDNPVALGDFLESYLSAEGVHHEADNFAPYPPSTQAKYSNIGFGLAGFLVGLLSGTPLNAFSAEHLFEPLGMESSGWMLGEIDTTRHAKLYEWDGQKRISLDWYGLVTWPDGGLRTSVRDLSQFYAAMIAKGKHRGERIMSQATYDAMMRPQFGAGQELEAVQEEEGRQQALAWSYRTTRSGQTLLGHSGSDPGVTTHAWFNPQTGTGAILLINTSSDGVDFKQAALRLIRSLISALANN
jgi:CubicO group peptidase (beta-lactamase class C family)